MPEPECSSAGGTYQGDETECADVYCGNHIVPTAPPTGLALLAALLLLAGGGTYLYRRQLAS